MPPGQLTSEDILRQIRSLRSGRSPVNDALRSGYQQAAAVLAAIARPEALQPLGNFAAGVAERVLKNDLVRATGRELGGRVMLQHDIRRAALRALGSREQMVAALDANPQERSGGLVQQQLEAYLRKKAKPLPEQTRPELEATLQVLVWLQGIIQDLPDIASVRNLVAWRDFITPFETLAGDGVFRGRVREMEELRNFVGVLPPRTVSGWLGRATEWFRPSPQPALSVYGPGGVGKSALIARFVLEHTRDEEDRRVPFAYLDFDRPTLSVAEPETLVEEMIRQIALQFPAVGDMPTLREPSNGVEPTPVSIGAVKRAMRVLLERIAKHLPGRPYVIVLDTFEQVQYRGERQARSLWSIFDEMQQDYPFVRIVISGRAPVTALQLLGEESRRLEIGDLDRESAVAFTMALGIRSREIADSLIRTVGGVPLSLKLAAVLLSRQPDADVNVKSRFWLRTADEVIQGQLFDRILGQIKQPELRRVAHPGLVLRRITPELLLEVLREPCQLSIENLRDAGELFEELRAEVSLVSSETSDGALQHRRELREVMLRLLKQREPAMVADISKRAVAYYSDREDRAARTERTYHELLLGRGVPKPVFDDVELRASIQTSMSELPIESQQLLATYGLQVDDRILARATAEQRERAIAETVEQLLPHGPDGLAEARKQLPSRYPNQDSPLWRADARLSFEAGDTERATNAIERGLRFAIEAGNSFRVLELLSDKTWQLEMTGNFAELDETLEQLEDYVGRHNDAAGRVQHFLQRGRRTAGSLWFDARKGDPGVIVERLFRALRPWDAFGLMPATRGFWIATATYGKKIDWRIFEELLLDRNSTFTSVRFADDDANRALQDVVKIAYDFESGPPPPYAIQTLERLAASWPFKNLHVHPPQTSRSAAL